MIELPQIIEAAKQSEYSPLPLEIKTINTVLPGGNMHVQQIGTPELKGWASITARYFKKLLRLHSIEQREAADLFISAMHQAHPNSADIERILRSEKIRQRKPITASQALRAYRKLVVLEETRYEYVDDGTNTNHKELKFMHGLVLKLKTFFR